MDTPCPPEADGARCLEHPWAPAVARCVVCGRFLCRACRALLDNRNYCRSCLAATGNPATPPGPQFGPGAPGAMTQWRPRTYPAPPPGYRQQRPFPPYGYPPAPMPYRAPREEVFPGTPWGVGEAVLVFAVSVILASAISYMLALVLRASFSATASVFLVIFTSSVVLYSFLLAGTFYSVKVRHGSTFSAIGLKPDGFGHGVALGFVLGAPIFAVAIGVAYAIQKLLHPTTTDQLSKSVTTLSSGNVGWGLIALLALTLVVLAPVCEEVFFRGYLYPALRNRMSKQPAMILNGVLFAAAHFEIIGFLPRFLLGWGLCYVYERNRTLGGPMTAHALYNALVLLLAGAFKIF